MDSVRVALVMLPVLLMILMIPVLIGVYVYRDASRRKKNGVLWALIAVLAPSFIGFIIYLLVRGNDGNLECPRCGAPVSRDDMVCPRCGTKLRPSCPHCTAPVEPDWVACPRCAAALPGGQGDVAAPVRHPDKTLRKILIAVILVPVFLLALIVASFGAYSKSGSSSFQAVSFAEYESGQESPEIREAVAAWIGGAEPGHGYALRYDHHTDVGDEHFYLIYVPGGEELSDSGFGQMSGLFGTTLELNLRSSGGSGSLFCMTASAEKPPRLKITLNGKKIPCDVTVVDYNPTLYFIEPGWENPPLPG